MYYYIFIIKCIHSSKSPWRIKCKYIWIFERREEKQKIYKTKHIYEFDNVFIAELVLVCLCLSAKHQQKLHNFILCFFFSFCVSEHWSGSTAKLVRERNRKKSKEAVEMKREYEKMRKKQTANEFHEYQCCRAIRLCRVPCALIRSNRTLNWIHTKRSTIEHHPLHIFIDR